MHMSVNTRMGWRFVTESSWTLWHPGGSRQGHPRYTGARTQEGVGGPTTSKNEVPVTRLGSKQNKKFENIGKLTK